MDIENDMGGVRRSTPARAPVRPEPVKEEDSRARAARRAAEVLENNDGIDEGTDEFRAPPAPDGWTYEWKRHTTHNMEDPAYQVYLRQMGWEPVPASRHPETMPVGSSEAVIMRKGNILMERPTILVDRAREIDRRNALGQVRAKEAQLAGVPDGGLGHRDHAQVKPKISKGFEPMPIPDK